MVGKGAEPDAYAFPGTCTEKVPYALGLPWPTGFNLQPADTETPVIPMTAPTVTPPEFNHHKTQAPREPAVPLPNYPHTPVEGDATHPAIVKRWKTAKYTNPRDATVSRRPRLDPDTPYRYIRFGEAYEAPVPQDTCGLTPKRPRNGSDEEPRESKTQEKVISVLGISTPQTDKPISRARARTVSAIGFSAGQVDRFIHRAQEKIISSIKISGDRTLRLVTEAERRLNHPISSVRTHIAKIDNRETPTRQERHTFDSRNGYKKFLKIHRGLTSGEVELAIRGHDWTRHFDCVLSLSQYSWLAGTRLTAALYFNDLPARLKTGVAWNRPSLTKRVGEEIYHEVTCECCNGRPWVSRTKWTDRSPQPQYAAVITAGHLTRLAALEHDPFEMMANACTLR